MSSLYSEDIIRLLIKYGYYYGFFYQVCHNKDFLNNLSIRKKEKNKRKKWVLRSTNLEKMVGIYAFKNKINNLMYVGQSKNIAKRKATHFRYAFNPNAHEYGWQCLRLSV